MFPHKGQQISFDVTLSQATDADGLTATLVDLSGACYAAQRYEGGNRALDRQRYVLFDRPVHDPGIHDGGHIPGGDG